MSVKRIRCECGRVYEPAKYANCPACGAQATVATLAPPKPPADPGATGRRAEDDVARPAAFSPRVLIIAGAIVLGFLLLVLLVRRNHRPDGGSGDVTPQPTQTTRNVTPLPTIPAAAQPTAAPAATPPQSIILPQAFDLAAAIASAAPKATIKVPPGFYSGGLVLNRAVRLIGTAGQTIIQSDGRECFSVRAPGVFVQGFQFICNEAALPIDARFFRDQFHPE